MPIANISTGPFAKGALSFVVPHFRNPHVDAGTARTDFAYSQFLRFLVLTAQATDWTGMPATVAEIGPGSSFGFGLCALLSGASRYYALDVIAQGSAAGNLRIFDELVALLRARAPIPDAGWNARIYPFVPDTAFPDVLLPGLDRLLADERVARIRANVAGSRDDGLIRSYAPWTEHEGAVEHRPDWIVSNSVMEHVDALDHAYAAFRRWSGPATFMTHLIDYSSHGITPEWNGHWAAHRLAWQITRGRRHYLINRAPHSQHLDLHRRNGFEILADERLRRVDGLLREDFPAPFGAMSQDDARTHLAFVVSRRAATA